MVFFYLFLTDGAIISAYLIFRDEFIEKMKFINISGFRVFVGVLIAEVLVLIELGFYGVFSYQIPYPFGEAIKGYAYMIAIAFIIGNSEEIFFRGFLPAVAEKYASGTNDLKVSKYFLIPALFSISHYFAWANSLYTSLIVSIYMFLYHFVFGVAMQYLTDYSDSIHPSIVAHTIYDATKMLMGG